MISIETALQIIAANALQPKPELCPLEDAVSRYLAEDILVPEDTPRFTSSAMDGYAVRWQDILTADAENPVFLDIVGESQAGIPFTQALPPGSAVRISTGAMVPDQADTVIRIEDTREEGQKVAVLVKARLGKDIRYRGEELRKGAPLFEKGRLLTCRELALLATLGKATLQIARKPRIALLVTGTELVHYSDPAIQPHQIRDSNAVMLTAAISEYGGVLSQVLHVQDSLEDTIAAIDTVAAQDIEIILCSGGVSVGRHDHVKDASKALGFTELFWKIRQKPGKPLYFSKKGTILLFGLPGNPVSAFMCFINYVRPVMAHCLGTDFPNRQLTGQLEHDVTNDEDRSNFLRVKLRANQTSIPLVTTFSHQGAHMISGLANTDGYIILQPKETVKAGSLMAVTLF